MGWILDELHPTNGSNASDRYQTAAAIHHMQVTNGESYNGESGEIGDRLPVWARVWCRVLL